MYVQHAVTICSSPVLEHWAFTSDMCGVFESVTLTSLYERYITNEDICIVWTQLKDLSLCKMALLFISSIKEFLWSVSETLLE